MFDVVEIKLQFFPSLFQGRSVSIPYLGPTGQARSNHVSQFKVRNLLDQHWYKFGTLWPRSNKPHIAAQHIPQLRNLIETGLTHEHADLGDARVVLRGPFC